MEEFIYQPQAFWLDGKLLCPKALGQTFFSSHSFHYGTAAFEGIRLYGQKNSKRSLLFKGKEHYERLKKSALFLGWTDYPYQTSYLLNQTYQIIASTSLSEAYVRPIIFLRNNELKIATDQSFFSLAIAVYPWPHNFFDSKKKEVSVALCPSQGPESSWRQYKLSAHYAYSLPFQLRAKKAGFDDILRVDEQNTCQEFSGANLGYVLEGKLYLPQINEGLNGITKQSLIECCEKEQILVNRDRLLKVSDLSKIDGLFSLGTATEICPINQVESYQIPSSSNKIIQKLVHLYQKMTTENISME